MASSSNAASGPRMTLTLSRSISSCALVLVPAGLPPVSAEMNSILRPAKVLLRSLRSVARPCSIWSPPCARGLPIRCGLRRDDREQQIGLPAATEMQRSAAAEHVRWAVDRIIVHERPAAGHRTFHVGKAGRRPGMLVVLAADAQSDAISGGNDDGRRPDFDPELDDLPGLQRLQLVMRVVGPIGRGKLAVELAMRGAQPALSDRRERMERYLEHHLVKLGGERWLHDKKVGIAGRGGHEQLCGRRAGDLGLLRQRRRQEGEAVAQRIATRFSLPCRRRCPERMLGRIEIKLRPLGARQRPFVLLARNELVQVAHLQQHARLPAPAALDALEKMIEELALQLAAVIGIKMRPMLDAVRLQPFLYRLRPRAAFEIAARVQALAAPVGGREQRHVDVLPYRRARLVVFVIERMRADLLAEIAAVFCKLVVRQRFRSAYQPAVHGRVPPALAEA